MKFRTLLQLMAIMGLGQLYAQTEVITGADVAVTDTESGKVRGFIQNGIYTYKGIPYATAERFMPVKKVGPWEGVRSSTMYGPVAPLMTPTTQVQDESEFVFDHDWGYTSEDCLRLNVWTPRIDDNKKRPVLFWIHGGGFTAGSSQELPSYHGENLSAKGDVVVVSINHRLNILGFLDLSAYGDKYKTSANNSMLDIVAALDWVKTNISNFGGDPNNVTIFGQSGGGAKVNTLMAMPKAEGLFHKAINQSGSFRGSLSKKETTRAIAAEVLKELSLSENQVDSLQTVPFDKLSAAGSAALQTVAEQMKAEGVVPVGMSLNWGPSMDGTVLPHDLMSEEAFELSKGIPLMLGTTKNEFTPFMNGRFFNASEEEVMTHIKEMYKDKADDYVAAVKKAYPNDTRPSDLLDIDATFRPGAVFQANKKSQLENGAPVYMYMFTWQSPVFDGKYKALHCMELPFVFDNVERARQMTGGGKEAHILADKMSSAWINFAKTGNPNHDSLPQWPEYDPQNTATMFFDNTCEAKPQHDKDFLALMADR
ncbi:carboxylesterase family protein [Muricauda oceani]|uniref:Carboxylic ester hydrolase n=1 Tax=Flagellimonas oceani TaxID=2698672 RepID=A0A6G7IZQ5_9FLAO|nr:carboxylesterase family protein [Allomuricauda oceani]MBW8243596.1 carboxylesterase family protein [Allomuricauda oceani]QII44035.1 carboxylesterase/lipase family protein [Allomuricauda oceani]